MIDAKKYTIDAVWNASKIYAQPTILVLFFHSRIQGWCQNDTNASNKHLRNRYFLPSLFYFLPQGWALCGLWIAWASLHFMTLRVLWDCRTKIWWQSHNFQQNISFCKKNPPSPLPTKDLRAELFQLHLWAYLLFFVYQSINVNIV